jgi:hypothetical protein
MLIDILMANNFQKHYVRIPFPCHENSHIFYNNSIQLIIIIIIIIIINPYSDTFSSIISFLNTKLNQK